MDDGIIEEYYAIIKNKVVTLNFDSALASIEKFLYNFPNDEKGYYYKGVCEFAKEKYEESIKSYKMAISLNIAYGKAYFNLGASYYILNNIDEALINIAKALIIFSKERKLDKKAKCFDALNYIQAERKTN